MARRGTDTDRDRPQAWRRLEQRHDLGVEDIGKWVRPVPAAWRRFLAWWSRIFCP
jgi:hypothetical protein